MIKNFLRNSILADLLQVDEQKMMRAFSEQSPA